MPIDHRSIPSACKVARLFPSLAMFSSFFLLGVFMSALGPSIPWLSRDFGVRAEAFGAVFSLRGMGYLLGSWSSSLTVTSCIGNRLRHALNNQMYRLGAATAGIGGFSILLDTAGLFWLVYAWCFCQGFCGGAIDTIANSSISSVHGTEVAPWMQGLHFFFSVGALVAPVLVGRFGYRAMLLTFGLLSMPAALACCLFDGGGICFCGREDGGERRPLVSVEPSLSSKGDAARVEDLRFTEGGSGEEKMVISKSAMTSTVQQDVEEGRTHSNASFSSTTSSVLSQCSEKDREKMSYDSPQTLPKGEAGRLPTLPLVALLVCFFFFYVGAEIGFGAWIAVVLLNENLVGEAGAASMASLFWGGITIGRLLAVPLAVFFSTDTLLLVNLIGGVVTSSLLFAVGKDGIIWAAVGAGSFGIFMGSTYPLAMSLLPAAGYTLSAKNSSRMVVGAALGEMLVPALIAILLGEADGGWPGALYATCLAISAMLMVLYCAWCSLLVTAKRRSETQLEKGSS